MLRQIPIWLCLLLCYLPYTEGAGISPKNDDFAHRRKLSGGRVLTRGTTLGATLEPGEFATFGNSVWFSWIAPSDRTFEVSLSPGSLVEVAAFTGTGPGALTQITDLSSRVGVRAKRGE